VLPIEALPIDALPIEALPIENLPTQQILPIAEVPKIKWEQMLILYKLERNEAICFAKNFKTAEVYLKELLHKDYTWQTAQFLSIIMTSYVDTFDQIKFLNDDGSQWGSVWGSVYPHNKKKYIIQLNDLIISLSKEDNLVLTNWVVDEYNDLFVKLIQFNTKSEKLNCWKFFENILIHDEYLSIIWKKIKNTLEDDYCRNWPHRNINTMCNRLNNGIFSHSHCAKCDQLIEDYEECTNEECS
jgi:hypothetical protein